MLLFRQNLLRFSQLKLKKFLHESANIVSINIDHNIDINIDEVHFDNVID